MKSFLFFLLSLILMTATLLLNVLARHFFLYWTTDWVNLFVHFLGGLGVGFLFIWFYLFSGFFKSPKLGDQKTSLVIIICLLVVGSLWEIYEYKIGLTFYSTAFIFDTIADLSMDLVGGMLAYLIAERFRI